MSTPALAQTNPWRVLATITPRSIRTMPLDSRKTSSIRRGSLWYFAAHSWARSEGSTESRRTILPSALDTIFCATTKTSPCLRTSLCRLAASTRRGARSSPGATSGSPLSGTICTGEEDVLLRARVSNTSAGFDIAKTSIRNQAGQVSYLRRESWSQSLTFSIRTA
jgi:hypothetical protein